MQERPLKATTAEIKRFEGALANNAARSRRIFSVHIIVLRGSYREKASTSAVWIDVLLAANRYDCGRHNGCNDRRHLPHVDRFGSWFSNDGNLKKRVFNTYSWRFPCDFLGATKHGQGCNV